MQDIEIRKAWAYCDVDGDGQVSLDSRPSYTANVVCDCASPCLQLDLGEFRDFWHSAYGKSIRGVVEDDQAILKVSFYFYFQTMSVASALCQVGNRSPMTMVL